MFIDMYIKGCQTHLSQSGQARIFDIKRAIEMYEQFTVPFVHDGVVLPSKFEFFKEWNATGSSLGADGW
jgi:hypothetical protein